MDSPQQHALEQPVFGLATTTPLHLVRVGGGTDEVVSDAEQSQQQWVHAHLLGKVSPTNQLRKDLVSDFQDVSKERNTISILNEE